MNPYISDPDFQLYVGDVREVLRSLPDGSVDCCVTSPPYWGLRDYGHDGQIGLEQTPEAYVSEMVAVFREVRRVLADSGTLWLNLGDSYVSDPGKGGSGTPNGRNGRGEGRMAQVKDGKAVHSDVLRPFAVEGLRPKNLVGIPWRTALALQADGWYLRSDIIWSKPNPMPESVTDRPTKAHEYVFLLTKSARYFFDQEAVREKYQDGPGLTGGAYPPGQSPHGNARGPDGRRATRVLGADGSIQHRDGERWPNGGRNIRSVWEIATQPYPDAHFATFPEALPERCIKAGCPEFVCATCGKARERIVERESRPNAPSLQGKYDGEGKHRTISGGVSNDGREREFAGWTDCGHNNYRPGTVLDPFMGSGTTALVARRLGRKSVGIELNPEYAQLAAKRLQQLSLLADTA